MPTTKPETAADKPAAKSSTGVKGPARFVRCFCGSKKNSFDVTEIAGKKGSAFEGQTIFGCDLKTRYQDEIVERTCLDRAQEAATASK